MTNGATSTWPSGMMNNNAHREGPTDDKEEATNTNEDGMTNDNAEMTQMGDTTNDEADSKLQNMSCFVAS